MRTYSRRKWCRICTFAFVRVSLTNKSNALLTKVLAPCATYAKSLASAASAANAPVAPATCCTMQFTRAERSCTFMYRAHKASSTSISLTRNPQFCSKAHFGGLFCAREFTFRLRAETPNPCHKKKSAFYYPAKIY